MSEWKPIESAPKDGRLIIITTGSASGVARWGIVARRDTLNDYDDGSGPCAQFESEYGWLSPNNKHIHGMQCTHWMPLPEVPQT